MEGVWESLIVSRLVIFSICRMFIVITAYADRVHWAISGVDEAGVTAKEEKGKRERREGNREKNRQKEIERGMGHERRHLKSQRNLSGYRETE